MTFTVNARLGSVVLTLTLPQATKLRRCCRELADDLLQRAQEGTPFEQLQERAEVLSDYVNTTLSEINEGEGMLLNEMPSGWRYSVRRMENPGDVTERRPVSTPEGLYIFQLIEKEDTPAFETLAEQFETEWEAFYEDIMNPAPEEEGDQTGADTEGIEPSDTVETALPSTDPEPGPTPDTAADAEGRDPKRGSDGTRNQQEDEAEAETEDAETTEPENEPQDEPQEETRDAEANTSEDEQEGEPQDGDVADADEETEEEDTEQGVYRKHGVSREMGRSECSCFRSARAVCWRTQ